MAWIGQQLIAPESGWKRYDERDPRIRFSSPTALRQSYSSYGTYRGTLSYIDSGMSNTTDSISFKFTGSKLIIGVIYWNTNEHSGFTIEVDGVNLGDYVTGLKSTITASTVGFVKTDFENNEHHVVIKNLDKSVTTGVNSTFALDFIDIDSTARLLHPDEVTNISSLQIGKRIRCHYQASASNTVGTFSGLGKETADFIPTTGSVPLPNGDFYFILVDDWNGDFRLIADRNVQSLISWDSINKEGMVYGVPTRLQRELSLSELNGTPFASSSADGTRTVEKAFDGVVASSTAYWYSDAAGSVQWVGYDFGAENEKVISRIGLSGFSHTYNYSPKNFIIQGSNDNISWIDLRSVSDSGVSAGVISAFDFNNENAFRYYRIYVTEAYRTATVGVVNTGLAEFKFWESDPILTTKPISIRLLTGGISTIDKDNEWDKYIVNSTLDGTIIAGDNNVWNWSGAASWTSTTNNAGSTQRTGQGGLNGVGASGYNPTSYATLATATGFRPMIMLPNMLMIKHFLKIDGEYKTYELGSSTWKTISATFPSEDTFINDGMDDLSVLDRKKEDFVQTMSANGKLGSGEVFKSTVNLKKYIEITSLTCL